MPSRLEPKRKRFPSGDQLDTKVVKRPFQLAYASVTAVASGTRAASRFFCSSVRTSGSVETGALGGAAVIAAAVELRVGLGAGLETAVVVGGGALAQATRKKSMIEWP